MNSKISIIGFAGSLRKASFNKALLRAALDVLPADVELKIFDLEGKPVAIMGASIGMLGSARAQYHLRQCFVFLNMQPVNKPEVMVPFVKDKIDENGRLTDKQTIGFIKELLANLVDLTKFLKTRPPAKA